MVLTIWRERDERVKQSQPRQFLRPVINDHVETRLGEGASIATVQLELSAIRGLFQFMLDMGAADVMFNPAKGMKMKTRKPAFVAQTVEQQAKVGKGSR